MINYEVPDFYKVMAEFQAEKFLQSIQFPPLNSEIRVASFYRSMESNQCCVVFFFFSFNNKS